MTTCIFAISVIIILGLFATKPITAPVLPPRINEPPTRTAIPPATPKPPAAIAPPPNAAIPALNAAMPLKPLAAAIAPAIGFMQNKTTTVVAIAPTPAPINIFCQ